MPKRLRDRWRAESISEFRAAAKQRFDDGLILAAAGRRTGAIYLWGYTAEMIAKAAYFTLLGIPELNTITWTHDLRPAIDRARRVFSIVWPNIGQGHNIVAWGELLISERILLRVPYPNPFALEVQKQSQRIGELWSETLRYHKNIAYLHEVTKVRKAVEWFVVNSHAL
jgi:hypothetical protein